MRFKARVSRSFAVPFFCPYIPGHLPRQPRRHSSVGCDHFAQVDTDKTVITLKAAPGSFFFRVFFVMLCLRLFFFLLPSKDGGRIKNLTIIIVPVPGICHLSISLSLPVLPRVPITVAAHLLYFSTGTRSIFQFLARVYLFVQTAITTHFKKMTFFRTALLSRSLSGGAGTPGPQTR